jgi:acetolactate synthase-1/2/3 large subunit
MKVGDVITEMLIAYGVKYVFGVPGGQTHPLYDGIHRRSDRIRHVLTRDECTASHAADTYARVTSLVGVCDATVGPGAIKLPSGIAEAYGSSTALLALAGDVPVGWSNLVDRGCAAQGVDQLPVFQSISKWRMRVVSKSHLPQVVRQAFAHAATGRPGPVVLTMPADILRQPWESQDPDSFVFPRHGSFPCDRPNPSLVEVDLAAKALVEAKRPVVVAGGGAAISGAFEELKALAEHLAMPVLTTVNGRGCITDDHPLAIGVVGGQYASEAANQVEREADLVLFVGCKSSQQTSFSWSLPDKSQRVVHLDVDGAEIGKIFRTEVGLVADAKATLAMMLQAVKERLPTPAEREDWVQRAQRSKAAWENELQSEVDATAVPIRPQYLMTEIGRRLGDEDIVVTDASQCVGWAVNYLPVRRAGRYHLFPRGSAILGFGLPAAIGARFAAQEGKVVLVAGDGGFAYASSDLSTLAKYGLNILVVVINNGAFGLNRLEEYLDHNQDYRDVEFAPANFALVAEGWGCKGIRVDQPGQLGIALDRAFATEGPVLVDVATDGWVTPEVGLRRRLRGAAKVQVTAKA